MLVAGLDEAGRGSVIGPMAVAGVLVDEGGLEALVEMGVRDSKVLRPREREELAEGIRCVVLAHRVILIPPCEIDRAVSRGALNKLEARVMADIICELGPDIAYVDASDVVEGRFARAVRSFLRPGVKTAVVAEHGADARYPVVAAASILAKVERDRAVRALEEDLGVEIGSGYPTDPRTLRFLRNWYARHKRYPDFVRRSWRTAREIAAEVLGTRLDDWLYE
ncbi:ribonuclease HII [Candidatus Bathyarchaeota archaeon]|nr:MAG: ribonuclease HII [Candidatus Bathyarchaeota archaeon]